MLNRQSWKIEFTELELVLIINSLTVEAENMENIEARKLSEDLVKILQNNG